MRRLLGLVRLMPLWGVQGAQRPRQDYRRRVIGVLRELIYRQLAQLVRGEGEKVQEEDLTLFVLTEFAFLRRD